MTETELTIEAKKEGVNRHEGLLDRASLWAKERLPDNVKDILKAQKRGELGAELKKDIKLLAEYNARKELVTSMKRDLESLEFSLKLKPNEFEKRQKNLRQLVQGSGSENGVVFAALQDTKTNQQFYTIVRKGANGELIAEERRILPTDFTKDVIDDTIISQSRLYPDGSTKVTFNFTELDESVNPHLLASDEFPRTAVKVFDFLASSVTHKQDSF